jgi:GST-like protein
MPPQNIGKGEQFSPEFWPSAPNNRMPAIVDHAPAAGDRAAGNVRKAVRSLIYLAEKTGFFLPTNLHARSQTLQWLDGRWGLGPMAGQKRSLPLYAHQSWRSTP